MNTELWKQVRFFNSSEFDSKSLDGKDTGNLMKPRLVFALDALRGLIGKPMSISSGYRTKSHNKSVGGAPLSAHLTGEAVDVSWSNLSLEDKKELLETVRKLGFTGIGIAKSFVHLDIKPRIASWRYVPSGQIAVALGQEADWV